MSEIGSPIKTGGVVLLPMSEDPDFLRLARALAWVARGIWSRLEQREATGKVLWIVFHNNPNARPDTATIKWRRGTIVAMVGLKTIALGTVASGIDGATAEERLLRYARVILAEEIFHVWEAVRGVIGAEDSTGRLGRPTGVASREELAGHYRTDPELRALEFVVEVTGHRADLLEEVRALRARQSLELQGTAS